MSAVKHILEMETADIVEALLRFNAAHPCISEETVTELAERGLFTFDSEFWHFGDGNNGTSRQLDERQKFPRAHNSGEDWHRLIGLDDVVRHDRKYVLFVLEGSKDALAAAEIAFRMGILSQTGISCALGSGYRPIASEIQQLRGRRVGLIGDRDVSGNATLQLVSRALDDAGVEYGVWDWSDWAEKDKDFYDVITTLDSIAGPGMKVFAANVTENPVSVPCDTTFSPLSSPSYTSPIQPFNPSTQQQLGELGEGLSAEERLGIVVPFIVTKRGTGNAQSFGLARAIKNRKFSMIDIEAIFRLWFSKSRPFLPLDANETESLGKFYDQLQRVRFTDAGLKAACERARTANPPFIPARDGDVHVGKVAALCRELQRDAGQRGFICPVNAVQQFLSLRWPQQANYLLHVLEDEGVIECVDRGAPNEPGKKGKSTMWRYKLPMS
jgi:hypothetical protein